MKIRLYLLCLIFFLCNSCIVSEIRNRDTGKSWDVKETIHAPDKISVEFGFNNRRNLIYEFRLDCSSEKLFHDDVKLNSFSVTVDKGNKPIENLSFMLEYSWDTIPPIYYVENIDSLPFMFRVSNKKNAQILFKIESKVSVKKIKKIYVNYDIEIGNQRIVRENVIYKKRRLLAIPH